MKLDEAAQRRLIWLVAATVVFAGCAMTCWPASRRIAELRAHTEQSYDETATLAVKLRRAQELRDAKARVRRDLRRLAGAGAPGMADAALLRLLDRESHALHVSIQEVSPGNATGQKRTGPLAAKSVAFAVRGSFRSLVIFLADLPKHDVLVGIDGASLQTALPRPRTPVLSATVRATLYSFSPAPEGSDRVRTVR